MRVWPLNKESLFEEGVFLVTAFCRTNGLALPPIRAVPRRDWVVSACAYYRPDTDANRKWTSPGINVCLDLCAAPAEQGGNPRNWNWPGNVTDREPYGVLAHELGHHVDWSAGTKKGSYGSEYSSEVMEASGEPPLTSYAPNPWEWFAETFRLFVTNHFLLETLRPRAYAELRKRWRPIPRKGDWRSVLGENVPERIVKSLISKGV